MEQVIHYYPQNFVLFGSNYSSSDSNRFATSNMTQLFSESNILNNYTNSSVYNQSSKTTTSDPELGGTQNTIQTIYSNGGFNSTAYSTYSLLIHLSPMEVLALRLLLISTLFK